MNLNKLTINKKYVIVKLLSLCLFIFSSYNLKAQTNLIEESSNIALNAVLNLNEANWQKVMSKGDSVFIDFYEEYTLDNIENTEQKKNYKNQFRNGLISDRQENFLKVYDYLFDRLEGDLSDYEIERIIGKNYYDYSDVYERNFDSEYFASTTLLRNVNTGNQVVLISNMIFSELVHSAGLSADEWHKNLVLKSFRIVKILLTSRDTDLTYLLDKYIRDKEKEPQVKNAVGNASYVDEGDLTIHDFKEVNLNFVLRETYNKINKIYSYDFLIDENETQFEESIVQDNFLVMVDNKRILYLDIKGKSFKGYFINENGQKQRLKFKRKKRV